MKRSWFGAGLLAVLLILGVISQWGSTRLHQPIREDLVQAGRAAQAEDWGQVDELLKRAEQTWKRNMDLRAAVVDHSHIEMIECTFATLKVQNAARDPVGTAMSCADLAQQVEALEDTQKLSWKNVL